MAEKIAAFSGLERTLSVRGKVTYATGEEYALTGEDVISLRITEGIETGLTPGSVLSAACALKLNDADGRFAPGGAKGGAGDLTGAAFSLEMGVKDGESWRYAPLGVYYCQNFLREEGSCAVEASCYDSLYFRAGGSFSDTLTYPCRLREIWNAAVSQAGYAYQGDLPAENLWVDAQPGWGKEVTLRAVMGYVAQIMGAFAAVDRTGALVLLPVKNQDAPYAIGPAAYTARRQGNAAFGPVSHLEVTTVAPAGDGAAESGLMELSGGAYPVKQLIRVSGNPLFVAGGSHTRGLAEAMLGKITGLEYRESRFSWRGDPALEIGGRVALTDVSGKVTTATLSRQILELDGGFRAECVCGVPGESQVGNRTVGWNGSLDAGRLVGLIPPGSLEAGCITATKLAAGSVVAGKIAAGAVEAEALAAGSVTADKLAAESVTAEKLAAESVTAAKIKAGAVDTDKLAAGAVTAEKIEAGSITADRMQAKTITAESGILADGVVGTAQIADGSITTAKIVELSADVITAGTLSVKRLILVGEDGLIYNINATASGLTAEELTDEKYQNQINGTVIVAKSITAAQIAAESITGNEILAGSITAGNIDVAGLFADEATINAINAMDISSNNYLKLMVETAVDDVQVGGRNYLLGTGEAYVAESDGSARTWLFPWKCADEDTAHSLYGKTITISFDYDQAITSGAFTLAFHHTWGAVKVFNAGTAAGQRFEETFDLPEPETFASNNPNVVIYIDGTWNGSVTFRNLKMEIGNKATDWTPAPEDGYKSSYIEIRDDHVDISTGGRFRVTSGDVDITTSKFSVSITDETGGEDELLTIDATGVRAANLSAPNVAMRYDGPWQIIVNSGATSAQVESGSYVRSMQEAFDRLNDRFLPYYAEVKLETDTYENVNIHGIYAGNGSLAIVGQGHTVYGRIIISNINTHMQAISLRACNANGDVWWIGNCRYVYLKTCTAEGYSTASAGYHIDYGSVVTFESCEVYNCVTGVDAGWGTKVDIATLKGTTTQYAYKAFGAVITNTGSRPSGIWAAMNCISMPNDLLTVPIDTGSGVVVPTTGSATFNPSATGTYTTYWWNIDSDVRQGYTKSNGRIKGGIFYAVSGVSGTVKSAILKLTRLKNYGKGAPVQVKVYGTVSTGKSGNPALSTEGYVLGTIDGGQTAEFALPAALATGLGNGTYKGIVLYADDTTALHGKTYSTNFARFSADASLTITWTV